MSIFTKPIGTCPISNRTSQSNLPILSLCTCMHADMYLHSTGRLRSAFGELAHVFLYLQTKGVFAPHLEKYSACLHSRSFKSDCCVSGGLLLQVASPEKCRSFSLLLAGVCHAYRLGYTRCTRHSCLIACHVLCVCTTVLASISLVGP